ncbi:MAG: 50S ribosomal protein L17 [Patescibacteria group bacterium]
MRKQNKGRKLGRGKSQRKALLKSLASSLFLHERIQTTEAKAKELRVVAEKMITRAKDNKISNRRILAQVLSPKINKKLMEEIAPKYKERRGGYTRIMKLGPRQSDGAKMVIIELVKE